MNLNKRYSADDTYVYMLFPNGIINTLGFVTYLFTLAVKMHLISVKKRHRPLIVNIHNHFMKQMWRKVFVKSRISQKSASTG